MISGARSMMHPWFMAEAYVLVSFMWDLGLTGDGLPLQAMSLVF